MPTTAATKRPDPRLSDARYDFRCYFGDPVVEAKRRLTLAFRLWNAHRSNLARTEIGRANRQMWSAQQQVKRAKESV